MSVRLRRRAITVAVGMCSLVGVATGVSAATGGAAASTVAGVRVPVLVNITAGHHPGYDRVVFRFSGGLPSRRDARYVSRLIADPSGRRIQIAGRAILRVTLFPAAAHTESGVISAPARMTFALPNVMVAVRSGDFESVLSYGIGLAGRAPFHIHTLRNPSRVVVDIGVPFRTRLMRVYFLNRAHFAVGREPYFTPVLRPVPVKTPATGLMDRLFAGPTPQEASRSLTFLSSRATGFTDLSVRNTIARVRLTGGCSSGGSTASIADEIGPTLKQLATVRYVKIYDPSGHTAAPVGPIDSRPSCLEP